MQMTENTNSKVALIYGRGRRVFSPPRLDDSTLLQKRGSVTPGRRADPRPRLPRRLLAGPSSLTVTETAFGRKSPNPRTINKTRPSDRNYYHSPRQTIFVPCLPAPGRRGGSLLPRLPWPLALTPRSCAFNRYILQTEIAATHTKQRTVIAVNRYTLGAKAHGRCAIMLRFIPFEGDRD
jgi:hypothetical protein